jgi:glycosyltransferase involved in cell wall biosynthesis
LRVLIDTTFALRGPSGTGVYLERLCAALREAGVDVVEAANAARPAPGGGGLRSARNLAADRWWVEVELPARARAARAAVVHHPLPAVARVSSCPQVVTVHDVAFERVPERFDARFRAVARRAHRAAARRAAAVVCVSHTTARDVRSRWGVPRERIVVAPHGPGQEPDHRRRRRAPEHLLYVGDGEARKNLPFLLAGYRAYREAVADPLPLVLAGTAEAEGPGIRVERRPEAERLADLYSAAAALVHPALYEGFGLTPLEAMSAGTPVLAVRNPGVSEVCGEAARYVDGHDARGLGAALAELAGDARARRDLSERGRRRAAEFSWRRSARAHVEAYTLALGRTT